MYQQSNLLMVNLVDEPWVGKFDEDDLMQFRIVILVLVPYGTYLSKVCIYTNCKMVLHILNHLTSRIGEIFINKCKKKKKGKHIDQDIKIYCTIDTIYSQIFEKNHYKVLD